MTFIAPAAGIVAALIGVTAVLALHMLKLRRQSRLVGSVLLWQQATRDLQVNTPWRMLRPSWLLLLHLLAALAIAAAISRPTIEGEGLPTRRVVILIDRSASMAMRDSVVDGVRASRFDRALQIAEEVVRRADSGPGRHEIMVASFAGAVESLTGFTTTSGAALEAIRSVEPSDRPDDVQQVVRYLRVFAAEAGSEATPESGADAVTVYLVTDGAWARPPRSLAPAGVTIVPRLVETEPVANLGIVALAARRDARDPLRVRVFASVQHNGASLVGAALRLSRDGQTLASESFEIAASTEDGPGRAAVSLTIDDASGGVIRAELLGAPVADTLASDDSAALWLEPPSKPRVLVLHPGVRGPDPFMMSLLDEMDLESLRARAQSLVLPEEADLVIFDGVPGAAGVQIPSLTFGADALEFGIERFVGAAGIAERFAVWKREHPVMEYVSLDGVIVEPAAWFRLGAGEREARIERLAELPSGPTMVSVEERGVQRVIAAFELARSNWAAEVSFPVFMFNAVSRLTRQTARATGLAFSTDEPIVVDPDVTSPRVELLRGETPVVGVSRDGDAVSLGVVERVGVYELRGAEGVGAAAVNLESAPESAGTPTAAALASISGFERAGGGEADVRIELWRWPLLLSLLVLIVEWFVYALRMRT